MTPFRQPEATEAYTRASVEAYLRAASNEKARLSEAIAEARKRLARAEMDEQYLIAHEGDVRHDVAGREPAEVDSTDGHSGGWDIEPSGGSFGATGWPSGTGFSPDAGRASSDDPGSGPPIAQLRLTPGAEDIWRFLDAPNALAHE
jgi:hypothetical protein